MIDGMTYIEIVKEKERERDRERESEREFEFIFIFNSCKIGRMAFSIWPLNMNNRIIAYVQLKNIRVKH